MGGGKEGEEVDQILQWGRGTERGIITIMFPKGG